MLYKKYHRNFVKQFKKVIKFRYRNFSAEIVNEEPYYDIGEIRITGSRYVWALVYSDGIINKDLYAIQEIS